MRFDVVQKTFVENSLSANKTAFVAADKELSWEELKQLTEKVAKVFDKENISAGSPVAVYGNKEALFLASIVACYIKGLPFIPIGPDLPLKRIHKILEQSGTSIIINCGSYYNLPELPLTFNTDLSVQSTCPMPEKKIDGAYVLFTSGSSGEPKGVVVTDKNVVAFTNWFTKNFPVNEKTVFINQAPFLFDISLADLFGSLHTGGTAVFNTNEIISKGEFFDRIKKYKGNYWNSTPSFLSIVLADKSFSAAHFPFINCFTLSGENLRPSLVKELSTRFPQARIINAYGPTEATIFSSLCEINNKMIEGESLPISAWPAEDISIEENEIIISGPQVANGYLNHTRWPQGKFCSGDLAEVKDGFLYIKGRNDEQIKFNGYRIELPEIKCALEKIDFILQAECLPVMVNGKIARLVAFVKMTFVPPSAEEKAGIKETLKKSLPHYMIPSEIIEVKQFPLTDSFKTDKQKLLSVYLNG